MCLKSWLDCVKSGILKAFFRGFFSSKLFCAKFFGTGFFFVNMWPQLILVAVHIIHQMCENWMNTDQKWYSFSRTHIIFPPPPPQATTRRRSWWRSSPTPPTPAPGRAAGPLPRRPWGWTAPRGSPSPQRTSGCWTTTRSRSRWGGRRRPIFKKMLKMCCWRTFLCVWIDQAKCVRPNHWFLCRFQILVAFYARKRKKGLIPSFILLAFVSSATHDFSPKKIKIISFFFFRWSTPARWSPATSSWSTRSCAPASPRSRGANNTDFPARKTEDNSNSRNLLSGNWTGVPVPTFF